MDCCPLALLAASSLLAQEELGRVPDLAAPEARDGLPGPGKRVRQSHPDYEGSGVYHLLYLPTDWEKGRKYPVIVEYAGNKYKTSLGTVEGSSLGYGISGGRGVIWICMPYVNVKEMRNEVTWWGDVDATVEYCKDTVDRVCREYSGDPDAVFIAGFSRGAIACNYIGLHDDEIARLWRGFIAHDHYDGVRRWNYSGSDRASAADRLTRLKGRPQYVSGGERILAETRTYLEEVEPDGNFTFQPLAGWGHTDLWVLFDVPERETVREWFTGVLKQGSVMKRSREELDRR